MCIPTRCLYQAYQVFNYYLFLSFYSIEGVTFNESKIKKVK